MLLLAACSFEHGALPSDTTDAIEPDGPPGCASFSSQLDTCALTPSDMDLTLSGTSTYNTDAGTLVTDQVSVSITRMQVAGKAGPLEVLIVRDLP
jgi:hypothetical protein